MGCAEFTNTSWIPLSNFTDCTFGMVQSQAQNVWAQTYMEPPKIWVIFFKINFGKLPKDVPRAPIKPNTQKMAWPYRGPLLYAIRKVSREKRNEHFDKKKREKSWTNVYSGVWIHTRQPSLSSRTILPTVGLTRQF